MDILRKTVSLGGKTKGLLSAVFALFSCVLFMTPAHANNNFPGTTITGISGSLTASNTAATGETGEPTTYGGGSLNSMWYSWTAPSSGTFTVQTCNGSTNFDTTLKTYTGTAVNSLTTVAANDDNCGLQSLNTVSVTGGTTYRIQVDGYRNNTGTFTLSWSFVSNNNADLSLSKTVSNASPTSGGTTDYTLTVTNAGSSTLAANSVTVLDNLPLGTSFNSVVSGTGTYNSGTGVWNVGTVPIGTSRSIVIRVDVTATPAAVITNSAEISFSSAPDPDSTTGNGSTTEDDDDSVSFTVAGARVAGTPPNLNTVCTVADQRSHLWSASTWTATSLNNSYTVTDIGSVNFAVTAPPNGFINSTPQINTANSGGFASGTQALYFFMNNGNNTHSSSITLTLPTAVPGLQFRLFDIDYAANQFTDKVTVTGTYNGSTVYPVLTNGVANYVTGNVAIGDGASGATDPFGNVVVTFLTPVDSVTVVYGNHIPTTPTSSGNQAMSLHDITLCKPVATLSVSKISSVLSDGVSASNPKAVPGATVRYCITVSNAGSGTATGVSASDNLPADVTFVSGSMFSGTSCGSAASAEDDNTTGGDESDPFGMSFAAGGANGTGVLTGTANSLAPGDSMALVFNVTLD